MPNRSFRLFSREGGVEQKLVWNLPLSGIDQEDGFAELLEEHGTTSQPIVIEGQPPLEVMLRPPIPKERIEAFGQAMVEFANSAERSKVYSDVLHGHEIRFWDQTTNEATLIASSQETVDQLITSEVVVPIGRQS